MEENRKFYLIEDRQLGKEEDGNHYLFTDGKWTVDSHFVIYGYQIGFDPTEPEGSPYAVGNTEIMDSIREITEQEAAKLAGKQLFDYLTTKWKNDFRERKVQWDRDPQWMAKHVSTVYDYEGIRYNVRPRHLGLRESSYDMGFMESVQDDMEKDLREYGASYVMSIGFLD